MKKIFISLPGNHFIYLTKLLMIMKLTTFLLLFKLFTVCATGFSQPEKVTLKLSNTGLKELVNEVEKQTQYKFLYRDDEVEDLLVNLDVVNLPLDQVLGKCLEGSRFNYKILENNLIVITANESLQQQQIKGKVVDKSGAALPGVSVVVKGTTLGTTTDNNGDFSLLLPPDAKTLTFSFIGMDSQDVTLGNTTVFNITLAESSINLDEVIVVGYGTQKKSDITGTVASLGQDRLEKLPNVNIAQAIQGSIAGVTITTNSAGANPDIEMLIRGRNSITASTSPLIVVDGVPYSGSLSDVNINDIKSLEVLKDASAAAIYGSRGSNGVILITTKVGTSEKTSINYDAYYSIQSYTNLPDIMDGGEFYNFKQTRWPGAITVSEQAVYDAGPSAWMNWLKLGLRKGHSQQHNLSASGTLNKTTYYISGGLTDVKGLAVNDNNRKLSSRINVDTKLADWFTLGTKTQLTYNNKDGEAPTMDNMFWMNPLTSSLDADGHYLIYPWPEDPFFEHPLAPTLYTNINDSYQISTNNYAIIDFPFIKGLSYRLNTGLLFKFDDDATYRGRNTKAGYEAGGSSFTSRARTNNTVVENILSYTRVFGPHSLFFTGVYSYENHKYSYQDLNASGFPNDVLTWYASAQASLIEPGYDFSQSVLISQMLRFNYSYNSKYLLTLTGRRDGYSGFGAKTKWGVFPSVAVAWNISNENFFAMKDIINDLKLKLSWGLNGNQAVDPYQSISRLGDKNTVFGGVPYPGYVPTVLGQDELGWESTRSVNAGFDIGLLNNRITGTFSAYTRKTTDLLLARSISSVHGITEITQNIGATQNNGIELTVNSRNIVGKDFQWSTSGNFTYNKNKILSLYGILGPDGKEIDDVANDWFIGQPIRVNYNWLWDGTWQLDEADQAASYGTKPGFVKLRDINNDGKIDAADRIIIGQKDPKFTWGMTNSFSYKNFSLDIFVHGVEGVTRHNSLLTDADTYTLARRSTTMKNWWTPDNPTNDWVANADGAEHLGSILGQIYESADFIRIKDVSLSYNFPKKMFGKLGVSRLRLFVTGHNLFTITKWSGLDPELDSQVAIPLQREFVFGINLGL